MTIYTIPEVYCGAGVRFGYRGTGGSAEGRRGVSGVECFPVAASLGFFADLNRRRCNALRCRRVGIGKARARDNDAEVGSVRTVVLYNS